MTKIDLSKFWEHLPSRDIEATIAEQKKTAAAAPSVSIGTVAGDVITVNVTGGSVNLAELRARKRRPAQQ